ncbi:GAF domain-containing protein [Chthonobacter rhizosphaerae]|uniref:GAF domain-containing protein n=1 Tax=Chthonobacter rhizosphaerae TaxID=2735553 RepID=UPI0015EF7755
MTPSLSDLDACFEGVIPSIVATCDAAGVPNVSYLSHVVRLDDRHVALSNQFFGKTARNVQDNPRASILLVDARTGAQYALAARYLRTVRDGPSFDRVAAAIRAGAAEGGKAAEMRLRGLDLYEVVDVVAVPSATLAEPTPPARRAAFADVEAIAVAVRDAADVEAALDALVDGLASRLAIPHVLLLLLDETRDVLVTIASRGFAAAGTSSEVPLGQGPIGVAAAERTAVRISDLSRVRRFNRAVESGSADEDRTRTVPLPTLPDVMSLVAVPVVARGRLHGVIYAESPARLAFGSEEQAVLSLLAGQLAASLSALEGLPDEPGLKSEPVPPARVGRRIAVVRHAYDDSVFIDGRYLVKGVPGRLLVHMLAIYLSEGRAEFTNRELRLAEALKLPDVKDNLETRLLLLRRRLIEKSAPIALERLGRGHLRLVVDGRPELDQRG